MILLRATVKYQIQRIDSVTLDSNPNDYPLIIHDPSISGDDSSLQAHISRKLRRNKLRKKGKGKQLPRWSKIWAKWRRNFPKETGGRPKWSNYIPEWSPRDSLCAETRSKSDCKAKEMERKLPMTAAAPPHSICCCCSLGMPTPTFPLPVLAVASVPGTSKTRSRQTANKSPGEPEIIIEEEEEEEEPRNMVGFSRNCRGRICRDRKKVMEDLRNGIWSIWWVPKFVSIDIEGGRQNHLERTTRESGSGSRGRWVTTWPTRAWRFSSTS